MSNSTIVELSRKKSILGESNAEWSNTVPKVKLNPGDVVSLKYAFLDNTNNPQDIVLPSKKKQLQSKATLTMNPTTAQARPVCSSSGTPSSSGLPNGELCGQCVSAPRRGLRCGC